MTVHTGTSGATPYVAGAAALLRHWLKKAIGGGVDPGTVYALLILFGSNDAAHVDNLSGAGRLSLGLSGSLSWGTLSVTHNTTTTVPLPVGAGTQTAVAALWWPEVAATPDPHNRVILAIVDPAGTLRADSTAPHSVFQRCSHGGGLVAGSWQLRIVGADVPHGQQQVHWATHTQP